MRVAIVSDIHGNLTAFEAVLADLRQAAPDLILHGGDLAGPGASPAEIVDRICDLGWRGVSGNTDEMLFQPESLTEFAKQSSSALKSLFVALEEMAEANRGMLGESRLAWLRNLPRIYHQDSIALIHARPGDLWRAPSADANDADLESIYAPLLHNIAIYGHIHTPFVRSIGGRTVANSGSVGLPYDGDRRASYLLLEDGKAWIRRVEYDFDKELNAVADCGVPHADWIARSLRSARPEMP